MSEQGWICIGTLEGHPLFYNPRERTYALEDGKKMRVVTSEELILKSKQRRSAETQSADA